MVLTASLKILMKISLGSPELKKRLMMSPNMYGFQNEDAGVTKVVCLVQWLRSYRISVGRNCKP